MLNSPLPLLPVHEPPDADIDAIVESGPRGAIVVAGIATFVVVAIWFAFYLFVFYAASDDAMSDETPFLHESPRRAAGGARRAPLGDGLRSLVVALFVVVAAFAGIHQATMPQARVETISPTRLHLGGEFVETNLGSAVEPDGSVTVRAIGQEYSFTPECIIVPADTAITFPRRHARRHSRFPDRGHQRQHDAGARLCRHRRLRASTLPANI